MELELRIEKDGTKKVDLPDTKTASNYFARVSLLEDSGEVALMGVVEGRLLQTIYKKAEQSDRWDKARVGVRCGPVVIGSMFYGQDTPEYQAFELLSRE